MDNNDNLRQNYSDMYPVIPVPSNYRGLTDSELKILKSNSNTADDWSNLKVSENFRPELVKNCSFYRSVYIGNIEPSLKYSEGIALPEGLENCMIINSRIGNNCAIHNVKYLANYAIDDNSILFNISEMSFSADTENNERWIEVSNENGGRKILAFEEMLAADAFLWSRFREEKVLMNRLQEITRDQINTKSYGVVGSNVLIKNCKQIKDTKIYPFTLLDGCSALNNCSICSSEEEATYIGKDVEIENSIIGFANKIFAGPKCFNIATGRNVKIELGARVLNSYIADNSTIACCEVLNNLIFPFHEQHHNNSFLIACTVLGQSNIAAGATIGSNHNSRAADGEILAGRGFWPGLESDFKHNSVFASFTLIAKGSYESEMDIKLPFSLISKNADDGILQIFPGFWFRYNMYALARNSWKFKSRDKRKVKAQNIEFDFLAPDTALEMMQAIILLEKAILNSNHELPVTDSLVYNPATELSDIWMENCIPKAKVHVIKPVMGLWLYKNMLHYFAAKEITDYLDNSENSWNTLKKTEDLKQEWYNFGGQLVPHSNVNRLISDISNKKLQGWDDIHEQYDLWWEMYPAQKRACAVNCWLKLINKKAAELTSDDIKQLLNRSITISEFALKWTIEAREKDYTNPFRMVPYRNKEEMHAVIGNLDDNSFIKQMSLQHADYKNCVSNSVSKI